MNRLKSFKGGIHPEYDGKSLTCERASVDTPLLEKYYVLLAENAGRPPLPCVAKGDKVKKYQLIAEHDGFVSADLHAPTSGEVTGIVKISGPLGIPADAIEIAADGYDHGDAPFDILENWQSEESALLMERIRAAGIVGMGGAAFPSHVKLTVPPGKKVDTLIINGAECEPFLTADHRMMVEYPQKVVTGAAIMGKILNVSNVIIGVEENKLDAVTALTQQGSELNVKVETLRVRYPQGSEKQLIFALTERVVPSGGLPADAGCVVQNAASAAAVYDAVLLGIPLVERIVTVTGDVVKNPGNFRMKIGTPLMEGIKWAGGVTEEPGKLILGGPMMGLAQRSFNVPVTKNTSGILLLSVGQALNFSDSPCIRCGRCVGACPMKLEPCLLCSFVEGGRFDLARKGHVMDCLECGACAYVCPSHRPLVQQFRRAKSELRKKK
ncbi:MAG: electron transport complex subunit RsxC [Lentisphaerae bacterium]|nr:electron transport complex subunit RsxC [Lentisphaerota bacterium]